MQNPLVVDQTERIEKIKEGGDLSGDSIDLKNSRIRQASKTRTRIAYQRGKPRIEVPRGFIVHLVPARYCNSDRGESLPPP